jgi:hypothetical protein
VADLFDMKPSIDGTFQTMASSDSDDEDLAKLREAVDDSTLKEGFYQVESVAIEAKKVDRASLRRDKRPVGDEVRSDLEVTPQFQSFVAGKLDRLIQLEDFDVLPPELPPQGTQSEGGIRLTKRSVVAVRAEDEEREVVKRRRPDLLAHRAVEARTEAEVAGCVVSGEQVLDRGEVAAWSVFPTFPDRVEPGEQRIKKKKKKVKNKKKSTEETDGKE